DWLRAKEYPPRPFFPVVDDEARLEKLIRVADDVVGGLAAPDPGILSTVPVSRVYGMAPRPPQEEG
ncbi:MAG TPA: hypothetical protein QGI30_04405, partial [Anaerolineales bacterium]|nr:hypothetical protein [Anaerolineales bacterium]